MIIFFSYEIGHWDHVKLHFHTRPHVDHVKLPVFFVFGAVDSKVVSPQEELI